MANDTKLTAVLEVKDNMTATIIKSKKSLVGLGDVAKTTSKTTEQIEKSAKKAGSGLDVLAKKVNTTKTALGGLKKDYTVSISLKDMVKNPLTSIKTNLHALTGRNFKTSLAVKDMASSTISKVKNQLNSFVNKPYTAVMNIKANMPRNGFNLTDKASNFADGIFMPMGVQMAGIAGAGFGVYDTVKAYTDFTAQMSTVKAISGANSEDMKLLTNKAKEMGATTQFSASEAGKALEYMAMAGWKTQDMLEGISGVMNLAGASGEDLATVSDIVTDALTAFNLKASDSQRFSDVLAAASSNSNTNVKMMGETFKYVAPIAGALGYKVEDTAVGIGLMANAGIKGSEAGTALRSVFTRLIAPPKDAATAMAKLGIQVRNSDGSIKPLSKTLNELRSKMAGLSKSEKVELANSLAGQEAMSGLLAMVNATEEDFNKLTSAIEKSEGAAKKMNDIRNDNLRGDLKQLASIWEGIQLSIMGDGEGAGGSAGETIRGVVKGLNEELTKFQNNIQTGLNFKAFSEIGKDAIQGLINKTLEFNGIGSILAGGTLFLGLTKIYNLVTKVAKKINTVIDLAKNIPENLPTKNQMPTTKDLVVNAQNVYVNGKNAPSGTDVPAPAPSIPDKTPKAPTNKPTIWTKAKDVLKTGLNYGGNISKAGIAMQIPFSLYDIYTAVDGERGATIGKASGSIAGGLAGAKVGGATGALLGSIIPGIGNVAGAVIGGVIGGIGGSMFGGDIGENIARLFDFSAKDNILKRINESSWGQAQAKINDINMKQTDTTVANTKDLFSNTEHPSRQIQSQQIAIEGQKKLFESLKTKASEVWNSITDTVAQSGQVQIQSVQMQTSANKGSWVLIQNAGIEAWEWIKNSWNEAVAWFDNNIYNPLKNLAQNAGSGIANGINSGLESIKSSWQGLKDWFNTNVFSPIKNQYIELKNSAPSPVKSALNFVDGGLSIGKNANGTMNWRGGLTEINERGGEIVDLPTGSRIYPAQTTERIINKEISNNTTAENTNINITGNTFIIRNDEDISRVAYELLSIMRQVNANFGGSY